MVEAVEWPTLRHDYVVKREVIELHVRVVLKGDVPGLADLALVLPARKDAGVRRGERLEVVGDDHADVLESHLIDVLMGRRDQLDARDRHARVDVDRLPGEQAGDRAAGPGG